MKQAWSFAVGAAVLFLSSRCAVAQEFTLFAGPLVSGSDHSYSWEMNYMEGFGKYFAGSVSWLNEGHIPGHHRDGQSIQAWARLPFDNRRFVFSLGVGPYRYFDTEAAKQGLGYSNTHGWGAVYSARLTWYASNRWTANLQLNRVGVARGPSTTALMLGVGYQLDAPDTPGPRDFALPRTHDVTNNEITLMAGETILNSLESQTSAAESIEYRRGITHWLDGSIGYLHEGNGLSARRDGATAQLWLTRAFLDDHLTLGFGAGLYAAIHHGDDSDQRDTGDGILSGLVSVSASYRFTQHWAARVTWNRVVTRYSRDTDVILGGIGYRF
ncbi:MAG: hypothetical protein V4793_14480 [Paraburkholderia tropica]|uniref:Uncharacterized protein n=1 Tax=Paraburkholderia tropica TaxID=92647 RepID=A0ABX5MRJ3_9BURK|nr:hypothetical protein [Paraburkholderia tropica]MBB3002240.1 hypothetical protein [Paraburkholderia tropica]MBB6321623.1 hypothetical protein [Paraburkholderia tropica]MDE1138737.1 hypothetical protein [Paraburkholderia tropica]PXX14247.1 hypothetical protein C7400_113181 [Paraburkholderia tropica]PZW79083.1 hypothetical protein C7399_113181 [Paraburkholderia tropica]